MADLSFRGGISYTISPSAHCWNTVRDWVFLASGDDLLMALLERPPHSFNSTFRPFRWLFSLRVDLESFVL